VYVYVCVGGGGGIELAGWDQSMCVGSLWASEPARGEVFELCLRVYRWHGMHRGAEWSGIYG
jgi:hypothetical protein